MVYIMVVQADGACRRNGMDEPVAAAACAILTRNRRGYWGFKEVLPTLYWTNQTNQRAELSAIILALNMALRRIERLQVQADVRVTVESDSKYAIGCMTEWIEKWQNNGWINAKGNDVANQDLLEEALESQENLEYHGKVVYRWIPREENTTADMLCNQALDEWD